MFITPKIVREAVADQTGGKADGIAVRIWAAAGFYFALGLLVGFLIWGGASLFGSAEASPLPTAFHAPTFEANFERAREVANEKARLRLAHAGQLSPKDNCHRHKAAGERHWHLRGTSKRGGPCVTAGGVTSKLGRNALCARERVALAVDREQGWTVDWKRHAEALKACIQRLPAKR